MPISQEALKIFEEEKEKEKKKSFVWGTRELYFEKPKKKIFPLTREERKISDKEAQEVALAKEIRLIRENVPLARRAEAFVQGLLPVGDKDILEKAFPVSNLAGTLTRYILSSQMIASKFPGLISGVHGYLSKPMQPLAQLFRITPQFLADPVTSVLFSESFPRIVSFSAQRALTWGANELGENIIRGITGGELSTKKLIWEPTTSAGLGAMMGGVHGVSGLWTSSLLAAGIGGGKEAIEQYVKDGKINVNDIGDILLQAGFYGMVEAIGHEQNIKMWRSKEMQNFIYNRWYSRLLGQGQSPKDAKFGAALATQHYGPAGSSLRRAAYERIIKPNLPEQVTRAKPHIINDILDKTSKKISHERSFADALSKTIGDHIHNTTQSLHESLALAQIDSEKRMIEILKRMWFTGIDKQEIKDRINVHKKEIENIEDRLKFYRRKKALPELPVFEEYLKLPAPKIKEGLSSYNQMRYGKALENILKDKLKYTDENISELKKGKSFSYMKQNAMTEQESARVIQMYEDSIEQAALHEAPSYKKTLKEVDNLRMKYLGAHEKGIFDDVLRMAMPDELKKDIGKDWTLLDWIRPTWRAFRKDPVLWNQGYQPINHAYAMKERFNSVAIQEARSKVKELGLTPDDLRQVTIKRHTDYFITQGQKDLRPITLTENQAKWNDWLTKQFEGLHSFFGVERMIPFHQYMPYLEDIDREDQGILSQLYPEYMPKNITAFFEKRRQSKQMDKFRENSLDLYEMYVKAGSKKKYMLPAIRQARRHVIENPNIAAGLKSHFQDWGTWMMGYPSLADNAFTAMFENMGLDYENSYKIARMMMDLVYMGGIGFRPMSAVRNIFQTLNTTSELGYVWTTSGFKDFMFKGGTDHARDQGILIEYLPELYTEMGQYSKMQKLRDASLFMFRKADEMNRSIAYYGAENKFNYFLKKHGNTDKFYQKSGIGFIDKAKRNKIRNLVNQGKTDQARHEFAKEVVAKTQYLYAKENSPLITRSIGGKLLFQFKSWPENYGELLADWGRNKNYMAFVRALAAYAVLGYMGKELGQKWLTRTIPIGTLPIDQWRLERAFVPATIGPIADVLFLFTSPMMIGLETQDSEAVQKAFEKRLKALGKDTLLYLPGGLALKDFFKVTPTIPSFSFRSNEQKPSQLKFKSLKQGESRLKFKKVF